MEKLEKNVASLVTKWLGLEGSSGDRLVQPPAKSRVNESRLLRLLSTGVLNTSRERHSTVSPGNLFW